MGHRFEYETPGFFKQLLIRLLDSLGSTESHLEFIYDKDTGQRIPLTDEESQILLTFGDRLGAYAALKNPTRMELIDRTFDTVSMAFFNNRNGDDTAYLEMISWSENDWDKWIASVLNSIQVK